MKKLVVFLFMFSIWAATAQKGGKEYTIAQGDNWYSVARKFNISYAELRLANKDRNDKLSVGQKIFIPGKLKSNDPHYSPNDTEPVAQQSSSENTESRIHVVAHSETLFKIAKRYNVSVSDIRKWNHLKGNSIKSGQVLNIKVPLKNIGKTEGAKADKKQSETMEKNPAVAPKPEIPSVGSDEKSSSGPKQIVFAPGRKEVNETGVAAWIEDEAINPNKYYALHRTASIGTIIKVINRMNNRSVYVKVVGKLPQTGDNEGLMIKISKAGADKLGVIDERFQAQLIYGISETTTSR